MCNIFVNTDNSKIFPYSIKVNEQGYVMITCTIPKVIRWTFNYGKLPDNAYPVGNVLHIDNTTLLNEGKYVCEGVSDQRFEWSNKIVPLFAESTLLIKGRVVY